MWKFKYDAVRRSSTKVDMKHFRMQRTVSTDFKAIATNITEKIETKKRKCICKLIGLEDEKFNFFPLSFLLYIMFLLSLCILIIINEAIQNSANSEVLYRFSIKSYHQNSINYISSLTRNNGTDLVVYVTDYMLLYGVMITLIWETLFTFFRYYTTLKTATKLQVVSTTTVMKQFIFYAIPFFVIYVLQIHVYYFLFPVVILLHLICNLYWTLKFASLLTERYRVFRENSSDLQNKADQDLLDSVLFMRKTSLICILLQTTILSLLVITYNINTIYYLPIFWSISCLIFALNFVRNKRGIIEKCFKCQKLFVNDEIQTNENVIMNNTLKLHIRTSSPTISDDIDETQYKTVETNPSKQQMSPIKEEKSNASRNSSDSVHKTIFPAVSIPAISISAPTIGYKSTEPDLKAHKEGLSTPILKVQKNKNEPQIQPTAEMEFQNPHSFPMDKNRNINQVNNVPNLNVKSNMSEPTRMEVLKMPKPHLQTIWSEKKVNESTFCFIDGSDSEQEINETKDDNKDQFVFINDETKFEESLNNSDDNDFKSSVDNSPYMEDAIKSFNILVSYGFCSKMHVNSLNRMKANDRKNFFNGQAYTIRGSGKNVLEVIEKKSNVPISKSMREGTASKSFLSLFNK